MLVSKKQLGRYQINIYFITFKLIFCPMGNDKREINKISLFYNNIKPLN